MALLMRMEELRSLHHPLCRKCRGWVRLKDKPFRMEKSIGATNRLLQYANRAGKRLEGMRDTLVRH